MGGPGSGRKKGSGNGKTTSRIKFHFPKAKKEFNGKKVRSRRKTGMYALGSNIYED